jgi:hypothetical protein
MILEMRTYLLKPGSVDDAERRFERLLPHRMAFSRMAALWHTEVGLLNQIIHLWPYESLDQRMAVRAEAPKSGNWPPPLRDILLEMESRIIVPAPFSPSLTAGSPGPLYEICVDSYLPGGPDAIAAGWAGSIEQRCRHSPLVVCGRTEIGPLNQWIHIWAYRDFVDRQRIQREVAEHLVWPPLEGADKLVKQERLWVRPAPCSPLQ